MSALHITNGDCAADRLRQFIDDPVIIAADVLYDGPAPLVGDDEWYTLRSRSLAHSADDAAAIRAQLAAADRSLDRASEYGEIVLWFEHDLFDQLNLVRTLDRLAGANDGPVVSLICIDRFPGIDRFIGLGQLDAGQLSTLVAVKQRVSRAQRELASRAWAAFRAPDPTDLRQLVAARPPDLPFLADALERFLAEYPSTSSGLSRTAESTLRTLASGPVEAGDLFARIQQAEARPFLGDWSFFDRLERLAAGRTPLVRIEPAASGRDLRGRFLSLTDAGARVLRGELDAVAANGIDEWRGGVHLVGADSSPWRWDQARKTLVSWDPRS